MSDHLDSISTQDDPRLDISDVYIFKGRRGTVLVMNVNPVSGANGFHPEAHYQFKIDVDHDNVEDITFRATFGDLNADGEQTAELRLLAGQGASDNDQDGLLVARSVTGREDTGLGGIRFWAGSAGDPFYIEGAVVTAVRTAVTTGTRLDLSGFDPEEATNLFAGTNVQSIVIEVPDLFFRGLKVGFWGAVHVPTDAADGWRQIDRAAIPLVSTLFGFNTADDYNATLPADDDAMWGQTVQDLIHAVIEANNTHPDPASYAADVRDFVMPDVLHYRLGTSADFPNGRNLTENTPEAMFKLVLNKPVDMHLGPEDATGELRMHFPYVALPVDTEPPATHADLHERIFGIPPHPRPVPPHHTHD